VLGVEKLSERLLLGVVTAVPAIRNRFPGTHDRRLSRSVRAVLTDLSAVEQLSRWRALPQLGRPGRVLGGPGERKASPAEENAFG
jgi:hypothetical protein